MYEARLYGEVFRRGHEVRLSELSKQVRPDFRRVQNLLYEDVARQGWFRGDPSEVRRWWVRAGLLVSAAGLLGTVLLARFTTFGLTGVALVLSGLLLAVLARAMPSRTAKGSALLAQAQGFRLYLATAEAEQLRFEDGEDVFSRYLPYAIAFGLADRWARVGADLGKRGAETVTPNWYGGPGLGLGLQAGALLDRGAFGSFVMGVTGFSVVAASAVTAANSAAILSAPGASGSSGLGASSSASTGGFSGEGAGGGGGGSW
jgi:hypothetical protein